MGVIYYLLFRGVGDYSLSRSDLTGYDFFESGEQGKRFGVYLESFRNYGDAYTFDVCWDTPVEYTTEVGRKLVTREVNNIVRKNIMVLGRYIMVQRTEERRVLDFVNEFFSQNNFLPMVVVISDQLLDYIEKRGNRLRGVVYEQKRSGRAEKVKLLSTSSDLRKTDDFRIYRDGRKRELKVDYGKEGRVTVYVKAGSGAKDPGYIGISSAARKSYGGIATLKEFIENLIEPNVRGGYQARLH